MIVVRYLLSVLQVVCLLPDIIFFKIPLEESEVYDG